MKRRIDDHLVVKQDSNPLSSPSTASVYSAGARGPTAGIPPSGSSLVIAARHTQSPAPHNLTHPLTPAAATLNPIGPPGPTVVHTVKPPVPVKQDTNMPGSLNYQGYNTNANPVIKGSSGGLQGGSPVLVTGGSTSCSTSSTHSSLPSHIPRHKAPRPPGSLTRAQPAPQRARSHDVAPPPSQVTHTPPTAIQQQQQQQAQFQRLKVEDALSYLDQVKYKFGSQPQVYNDFLDIMKEFKSQSIDTPGVIQRVSQLFKGHPELIVGFNTFLPPGYKIEVQTNDQGYDFQVSVSMPSPTSTSMPTVTHHTVTNIPLAAPVSTPNAVSSTNLVSQSTPPSIPMKPTIQGGPLSLAAVHHAATTLHGYASSGSPHHPTSGTQPPPVSTSSGTPSSGNNSLLSSQSAQAGAQILTENMQPTPQQPVDFTHAINYVNKIKNRFQGQPDKYKSFLDILHAYQKEQRNLKEGLQTAGKHLTEAEVYSQVAKLFENQEDLVQEFGQFLPDATSHQAMLQPSLFLAQMGAVLQGNKGLANDHTSAKKPVGIKTNYNNSSSGGINALTMSTGSSSKFGQQVKRSPSFSTSSQPPTKKPKMTSLKDVSLAEAAKYGSLNDFAFFDKVRKALKSNDVYENFLRCLILFNQEIVSSPELIQLATPFLGRFPDLLKWLKDFVGQSESGTGASSYQSLHVNSGDLGGANSVARADRDRSTAELAMDIDYTTCKRLGASYCALPKTYVQPKCSGRTPLCKEVLNDTWVSFPTWSEDSTFVTSRKTQYEEYIYRCEDERFELDVVLETNAATIKVLEAVFKKMQRLSPEELAKYHLDDNLGGSSPTIHQRALRRIYGDKANDIILGLKKNPSAAVSVVLKRLKAKEEEWREAQKGFNKIWRDQNEKYYLKSLDHQGMNFKQNDMKALRSKALFNEIETLYDERHEQAEEHTTDLVTGPHLILPYRDKSVLDDAANLLIHHVKRQTAIHKDDKQSIKQLLRQFIPDLFFHPRQDLSDDERDEEDGKDETEAGTSSQGSKSDKKSKNDNESKKDDKKSPTPTVISTPQETTTAAINVPSPTTTTTTTTNDTTAPVVTNGNSNEPAAALPQHAISSHPDECYTMFMCSNTWYLFLRLHQILCDRLTKMYERAVAIAAEENINKKDRKESTAVALRLKPKNEIDEEDYYPAFLDMVKNVLDGNMDSNAYEDTLREMFGIHAYVAFTLDKVVSNAVRQLQALVGDESAQECLEIFHDEKTKSATGGLCSQAAINSAPELAYQRRVETLLNDENCYKVFVYKIDCKTTIELLDSEVEEPDTAVEAEKSATYLEKYVGGGIDTLTEDVKERLARKPVFLSRNIRQYEERANKDKTILDKIRPIENKPPEPKKEEKTTNGPASTEEDDKNEKEKENKDKEGTFKVPPAEPADIIKDETECRFNLSQYTKVFVINKDCLLYKRDSFTKAKKSHPKVSKRLNKKFRAWHFRWADKNVSSEQQKQSCDWLMGLGDNVIPNRTRILTDNVLSKPPYRPYNRYRVDRLAESTTTSSTVEPSPVVVSTTTATSNNSAAAAAATPSTSNTPAAAAASSSSSTSSSSSV